MSNFTDVDALAGEPGVRVRFARARRGAGRRRPGRAAGHPATVDDLAGCGQRASPTRCGGARPRGARSLGICGGYQMLGQRIDDDVESGRGPVAGLGLLPVDHDLRRREDAPPRRAGVRLGGTPVAGYEIRHGRHRRHGGEPLSSTTTARAEGCSPGPCSAPPGTALLEGDDVPPRAPGRRRRRRGRRLAAGDTPFAVVRDGPAGRPRRPGRRPPGHRRRPAAARRRRPRRPPLRPTGQPGAGGGRGAGSVVSERAAVTVVGIGDDGWAGLTETARAALRQAPMIVGSTRQLALLPDLGVRRQPLPSPLLSQLDDLVASNPGLCLLASGDPMLHGLGATLARRLGAGRLRVPPRRVERRARLRPARLGRARGRRGLAGVAPGRGGPAGGAARRSGDRPLPRWRHPRRAGPAAGRPRLGRQRADGPRASRRRAEQVTGPVRAATHGRRPARRPRRWWPWSARARARRRVLPRRPRAPGRRLRERRPADPPRGPGAGPGRRSPRYPGSSCGTSAPAAAASGSSGCGPTPAAAPSRWNAARDRAERIAPQRHRPRRPRPGGRLRRRPRGAGGPARGRTRCSSAAALTADGLLETCWERAGARRPAGRPRRHHRVGGGAAPLARGPPAGTWLRLAVSHAGPLGGFTGWRPAAPGHPVGR